MIRAHSLIFAAAIALAACGQTTTNGASAGKPGQPAAAAPATPQPVADNGKPGATAPAQANLITPAFMIGRWGDNGDCNKDIVFNTDGTYRSYTGGVGRWQINGDTITMSGSAGSFSMQMQWIDQDHMMLRNPDGSEGTSQRC